MQSMIVSRVILKIHTDLHHTKISAFVRKTQFVLCEVQTDKLWKC